MAKRPKAKIDTEDEDTALLTSPKTSEHKKKKKLKVQQSTSSGKDEGPGGAEEEESSKAINNDEKDNNTSKEKKKLEVLEAAYKNALNEFKKDKTNKDLRRAKSEAKKAYDAAVLQAAMVECNGTTVVQITCKDCSQIFVHVVVPQAKDGSEKKKDQTLDKEYLHRPTRCPKCNDTLRNRLKDRSKRDSTGKNMCYAFQRGECTRGNRCKFSHNLEHGGSINKKAPLKPMCHDFLRTGKCERGSKCRFRHEKTTTTSKTPKTKQKVKNSKVERKEEAVVKD